jgi:hypothetical protein
MRLIKIYTLSALLLCTPQICAQFDPSGSQYISIDRMSADPLGFFRPSRNVSSLIGGDFDRDGVIDLAVGLKRTSLTNGFGDITVVAAGSVHIFFGAPDKFSVNDQRFVPPPNPVNQNDFFGGSMTVGNVDGFGTNLVIGMPLDQVGSVDNAGSVVILYSNQSGLDYSSAELWNQDFSGVSGSSEPFDEFGDAVVLGDFDADGFDDLVVGVPGEAIGTIDSAGIVNVLIGTSSGLSTTGSFSIRSDSDNVPGTVEALDLFGDTLAVGNFDCDAYEDLALAAPGEAIGTETAAGGVWVFYGSSIGLDSTSEQPRRVDVWNQDSSGIKGTSEEGDAFGGALVAGDFNDDGCDDLAIGVYGEAVDSNTVLDAGAVAVIYGSQTGLVSAGDELWTESDLGPDVSAEFGARFGWALSAADFNKDGFEDLAASSPGQARVSILYGSEDGLLAQTASTWTATRAGTSDCELMARDGFGNALTTADWNRDGLPDLAVASELGVHVLFNNGSLEIFQDRFEASSRARQSTVCL